MMAPVRPWETGKALALRGGMLRVSYYFQGPVPTPTQANWKIRVGP
jgi:hypothetical protein